MTTFYLKPGWVPPSDEVNFDLYRPEELFRLARRFTPSVTVLAPTVLSNVVDFTIDGVTVDVVDINITAEIESFCWSLTATVASKQALSSAFVVGATFKDATVTINGHQWKFIIEQFRSSLSFGNGIYRVSGRSLTAELARPNSQGYSRTESNMVLASDFIETELSRLGGYTLNFNIVDWYINSKVISYINLSPLQAIKRVTTAVGASIYSDPANKTVSVDRSYRVRPQDFDWTDPELTFTNDCIINISAEYRSGNDINSCRVSGDRAGVSLSVLPYNGTFSETWWGGYATGEALPSMIDDVTWNSGGFERSVSDSVITSQVPAVLRGAYELDRELNYYQTDLTTYLDEHLVTPGLFVEVQNLGGCGYRGIVDRVSVTVTTDSEGTSVRQTGTIKSVSLSVL